LWFFHLSNRQRFEEAKRENELYARIQRSELHIQMLHTRLRACEKEAGLTEYRQLVPE
jgi:hypothetical protein